MGNNHSTAAHPEDTGLRAVLKAAEEGNVELLSRAMEKDISCVTTRTPWGGNSAWHKAAKTGQLEVVKAMAAGIERAFSPQQAAGGLKGRSLVLKKGPSAAKVIEHVINVPNVKGITPTMLAAASKNLELLQWMINMGADLVMRDQMRGQIALHYAVASGDAECTRVILSAEADKLVDGIKMMDAANFAGLRPLHYATYLNHQEVMKTLLSFRTNLCAKTYMQDLDWPCIQSGDTPMHVAASKGNLEAIKIMLKAFYELSGGMVSGAGDGPPTRRPARDPRGVRNAYGRVPYHLAVRGGFNWLREMLDPAIPPRLLLAGEELDDYAAEVGPQRLAVIAANVLHRALTSDIEHIQHLVAEEEEALAAVGPTEAAAAAETGADAGSAEQQQQQQAAGASAASGMERTVSLQKRPSKKLRRQYTLPEAALYGRGGPADGTAEGPVVGGPLGAHLESHEEEAAAAEVAATPGRGDSSLQRTATVSEAGVHGGRPPAGPARPSAAALPPLPRSSTRGRSFAGLRGSFIGGSDSGAVTRRVGSNLGPVGAAAAAAAVAAAAAAEKEEEEKAAAEASAAIQAGGLEAAPTGPFALVLRSFRCIEPSPFMSAANAADSDSDGEDEALVEPSGFFVNPGQRGMVSVTVQRLAPEPTAARSMAIDENAVLEAPEAFSGAGGGGRGSMASMASPPSSAKQSITPSVKSSLPSSSGMSTKPSAATTAASTRPSVAATSGRGSMVSSGPSLGAPDGLTTAPTAGWQLLDGLLSPFRFSIRRTTTMQRATTVNDDELTCGVCLDATPTSRIVPCSHMLCADCALEIIKLYSLAAAACPFCRGLIRGFAPCNVDLGAIKRHLVMKQREGKQQEPGCNHNHQNQHQGQLVGPAVVQA